MDGFAVDPARVTGLGSDLADLADNVRSTTQRITGALVLPAGTAGLLSTIGGPLLRFGEQVSEARGKDQHSLRSFGSDLAAASRDYVRQDDRASAALAAIGGQPATAIAEPVAVRFPALELPSVPDVESPSLGVRDTVETAARRLAPYEDRLGETIGIRPVADFLTPVSADWEQLRAIGATIRQLGTTDRSLAGNVRGGVDWISHYWSGPAAQAFAAAATGVRTTAAGRATHMGRIAIIVERGGWCLERLVRNQAAGLTADVLRPMSFLRLTLPLGIWGRLIGQPIQGEISEQIQSRIDDMKLAAQARHNQIQTILGHVRDAFDYTPGGWPPRPDESLLRPPNAVVEDATANAYGHGSNIWWEDDHASAA